MVLMIYRVLFLIVALYLCRGCSKSNNPILAPTPTPICSYDQKIEPVENAIEAGSIFLFGETHGTEEAPDFVASFACYTAKKTQQSTIVLLELPIPKVLGDEMRDPIPTSEAKRLILSEGDFYWARAHDGRTSVAMMEAIEEILLLREQGLNVYIGTVFPDKNIKATYENLSLNFADEDTHINRFFQETLQILSYRKAFKNVIVLTGKNHTRNHLYFLDKLGFGNSSMGFLQQSGGGNAWNCPSNQPSCGTYPVSTYRRALIDSADHASLVMLDTSEDVYDGAFVFKTTTASPPYINKNVD